jgi:DNA-binding transcriptional regulator YiaG
MAEQQHDWDAETVRALRQRLGLSQRGLAEALGVRQQTVSEWETGAYRPRGASARMLRLVAEQAPAYSTAPAPDEPHASGDERGA